MAHMEETRELRKNIDDVIYEKNAEADQYNNVILRKGKDIGQLKSDSDFTIE